MRAKGREKGPDRAEGDDDRRKGARGRYLFGMELVEQGEKLKNELGQGFRNVVRVILGFRE